MIAAIYARKSIETDKGESIDNQIQLCKEVGIKAGVTEFIVYKDEGFSGKNTNRPRFKQMMNDARNKKFSMLICYRLDRISRNVADFSSTLELLQNHGIDFVSIKESFDTSTPMGRAMVYIASVFAQLERETIAERVKDNMLELSKTGRWLGGTPPLGFKSEPIDYKSDTDKNKKMYKLVVVPEEIEVVKLIYNLYLEKKGFPSVANYLCSHCYKGKNGGEFSRATVEQIIKNPVYTFADKAVYDYFNERNCTLCGNFNGEHGVITYNKREKGKKAYAMTEWIIAVGKHPGIIPSDLWIKCQNITKENTKKTSPRASSGNKFLLSGLLICGHCGSSMSSWSRNNPKSEKYERYYRCNLKNRAANRCSSKLLNADRAEDLVLENLKGITIEQLVESYNSIISQGNNKNIQALDEESKLQKEIENNSKLIQGLIRKLAFLEDTPSIITEVQKEIQRLQTENSIIEKDLQSIRKVLNTNALDLNFLDEIEDKISNFKKIFSLTDDIEKKRYYLLEIVSSIVWNSDDRTLKVNLFNSNCDVPTGGVKRRKDKNLCFGDVSR
jgi:site-specific DNA recombinase